MKTIRFKKWQTVKKHINITYTRSLLIPESTKPRRVVSEYYANLTANCISIWNGVALLCKYGSPTADIINTGII